MANLNFVLLYVEDVAASEAFYAKVFGRAAIESSPSFAMIPAATGVMLGLWRRDCDHGRERSGRRRDDRALAGVRR